MTVKVVYNSCYGGYGLSKEAVAELGLPEVECLKLPRHDPRLVAVVERLGKRASDWAADLQIQEVADRYWIEEYDGSETVWEPETIPWVKP